MNNTYTFIIPYYNDKKFIKRCLTDISKQTYLPSELFIVDDCSDPDQKFDLNYVNNITNNAFKVLIIYNKKNIGGENSINKVLNLVKTKYFKICATDDRINKNLAEESINLLSKYQTASYVFSSPSIYMENKKKIVNLKIILDKEYYSGTDFQKLLKNKIFRVYSNSVFYNTNIFIKDNIFFKNYGVWSDWLNHIHLGSNHGVCYLNKHLTHYSIHPNQYNKQIKKEYHYLRKIYKIHKENKVLYKLLIKNELLYDFSPLTIFKFKNKKIREIYSYKLIYKSLKFYIWKKIKEKMPQKILNLMIKLFS